MAISQSKWLKRIEKINNELESKTNNLNNIQTENEKILQDLKQQLTTNTIDTQTTIKNILTVIDTKIESITETFKIDIKDMLNKFNEEIKNINDNLNTQEINIFKLQEMSHGILRSEGDNYVVVK